MTKRIYLDNNATTFIDPRVADSMIHALHTSQGNASSIHSYGQNVRKQLTKARNSIASFLGVKSNELVFTSGGSEGLNMVIRGVAARSHSGHIVTSSVEHSSVFTTIKELEQFGIQATFLSPGDQGAVSREAVAAAIRPDTKLIALMAVNNETGVKTDVDGIAALAHEAGIPLLVDAVALMGKEHFTIAKGVTAMCFSGHKFHAPQGTGFAFLRSGFKILPMITGGEQEWGRRAGTENIPGILSLAKAVEILSEELPAATKHMLALRHRFEGALFSLLPNVHINGEGSRTVNVSNLAFSGIDGETLLLNLDAAGIAASHGSACASGAIEPSRILLNMGIPIELVHSSIRFSFSRFTTEQEIDEAVRIIVALVKRLGKAP